MSEAKGPYKQCEPAFDGFILDSHEAYIANLAYDSGRASRDGLRVELERLACIVDTYLKDGCNCDNGSPTEDCFCIKEEDTERAHKALEADGEVGK